MSARGRAARPAPSAADEPRRATRRRSTAKGSLPDGRFTLPLAPQVVSVRHERRVPISVQGRLGSCAGHAAVGLVCTDPFYRPGRDLGAEDAVAIYSAATRLDDIDGAYPPDDTGTRGRAVMEVLKRKRWIGAYAVTSKLDIALRALVLGPGITGFAWREGCDRPDATGLVRWVGESTGGHQVLLVGIDADRGRVWLANSFGHAWGVQGFFAMTFADYEGALAAEGEALFASPPHPRAT